MNRRRHTTRGARKGAVTVEMAIVAPVFVAIVAGIYQASELLDTQNVLATAAREGARLAAMDRSDLLEPGQTTNQKIAQDVRNFLTASGLNGSQATVQIVDPTDHVTTIDLDDPDNELRLFELRVLLPFSTSGEQNPDTSFSLIAKLVFRNAPASLVQ